MAVSGDDGFSSAGEGRTRREAPKGEGRDKTMADGKGKKNKGKGRGKGNGISRSKAGSRDGRTSASSPAETRRSGELDRQDWSHPGAMPLSELEVDALYDGVITNVGPYGVFVDFGAVKDGLLRTRGIPGRKLKVGMALHGLRVLARALNPERVILGLDDWSEVEELVSRPTPRNSLFAPEGIGTHTSPQSSSRRPQRPGSLHPLMDIANEERVPLEELESNIVLEGVVNNVGPYGVFLDVGATSDARLRVSVSQGRKLFRRGDELEVHVDWVDPALRRIQVSLLDAPASRATANREVRPGTAQPRTAAAAKGAAGAKPPGSRASRRDASEDEADTVEVGSELSGVVTLKSRAGIIVDIGGNMAVTLQVPPELERRILVGDRVFGMHVVKIGPQNEIFATLYAPELHFNEESEEECPEPAPQVKPRAKSMPEPGCDTRPLAGKPLTTISVGDCVDGVVTKVKPKEVWVDIGRGPKTRLVVAKSLIKQFRPGDEVLGMIVERIGPGVDQLVVSLLEPVLELPDSRRPPAAPRRRRPEAAGRAPLRVASGVLSELPADVPRRSLENIGAGLLVSGAVTERGPDFAYVDFGAEVDGLLRLRREDAQKMEVGDEVEAMVIQSVNCRLGKVVLALTYDLAEEPEVVDPEEAPAPGASRPRPGRPTGGGP